MNYDELLYSIEHNSFISKPVAKIDREEFNQKFSALKDSFDRSVAALEKEFNDNVDDVLHEISQMNIISARYTDDGVVCLILAQNDETFYLWRNNELSLIMPIGDVQL